MPVWKGIVTTHTVKIHDNTSIDSHVRDGFTKAIVSLSLSLFPFSDAWRPSHRDEFMIFNNSFMGMLRERPQGLH